MVNLKARELKGNLLKVRGPSCATQPSVIFLKFTQLKRCEYCRSCLKASLQQGESYDFD